MSQIKTSEIAGDVAVSRHVTTGGNANIQGSARIGHNLKVEGWLDAPNIKGPNKGVFLNEDQLKEAYPMPRKGWWALVGDILPAPLYVVEDGKWVPTGEKAGNPNIDMEQYREEVIRLGEAVNDVKEGETENSRNIDQIRQIVNSIGGSLSTLENKVIENEGNLAAEATARASADNEMMAVIELLRRALDESEDGTFAQAVREDIRDLFSALSRLRDDQKLTQEDIDSINTVIDSILGENASDAIDNFREILAFLDGVKDTESLFGLLENIRQMIRDDKRDLQSHSNDDKAHIRVISLVEEDDLDDGEGAYVRPGLYRVRLGSDDLQPDRDGDLLLLNVWGRWDYTGSEEDGIWEVPVYRVKISRSGVWVQSGTYRSDDMYDHDGWKLLGSGAGVGSADSFTDEEIEQIALSVGGYILPAEAVEPITDPEIDRMAVKSGIMDIT